MAYRMLRFKRDEIRHVAMLRVLLEYVVNSSSKQEQISLIRRIKADDMKLFFSILYNITLGNKKVVGDDNSGFLKNYQAQLKSIFSKKKKSLEYRKRILLSHYSFLCAAVRAVMHGLRKLYDRNNGAQ